MFNLIRRDPDFARLFDISREFTRFLGDNETGTAAAAAWLPAVDIIEGEEELRVVAEVPGLTRNDIELTVTNNVLTLSGERKGETEEKGKTWHRVERHYGRFARSFTLPREVDAGGIKASYENGVLEVVLPKAKNAIPQRIQIGGK